MKATELRIGNLVLYNTKVAKVTGLNTCMIDIDEIFEPLLDDNFLPIPLTEEWLLKFGFQRYGTYMGNPEYNRGIHANTIRNYDDRYYFIDNCDSWMNDRPVKYVHELQNLYFALTGEELTV